MAKIVKLNRVFTYAGMTLPDPDPALSIEEVLDFYGDAYPELRNGFANDPEVDEEKGTITYALEAQIRRKGGVVVGPLVISKQPKNISVNVFTDFKADGEGTHLNIPLL